MRLPPVWLALLTASATLGLSNSVSGQTVISAPPKHEATDTQPSSEVARTSLLSCKDEEAIGENLSPECFARKEVLSEERKEKSVEVGVLEPVNQQESVSLLALSDSPKKEELELSNLSEKVEEKNPANSPAPEEMAVSAIESQPQTPAISEQPAEAMPKANSASLASLQKDLADDRDPLSNVSAIATSSDRAETSASEVNPENSNPTTLFPTPTQTQPNRSQWSSVWALSDKKLDLNSDRQPPDNSLKFPLASVLALPSAKKSLAQTPEPTTQPEPTNQTPPPPPTPIPPQPSRPVPSAPSGPSSNQCPDPNAPQVLVAEIVVSGVTGEAQDRIYKLLRTQPGRTTNRCQLQEDVNAIFALGEFATVDYQPEDTPLGVRVTFVVQQNPILRNVVVNIVPVGEQTQVIPQTVVDEIFRDQYGQILNLRRFQEGVKRLNQWYKDNGYILAQVVGSTPVDANGNVTLQVAEGIIEDIQVRFLNKDGEPIDKEGKAIQGRTRKFIITREMLLKPGEVLREATLIGDLRRIFGLGIFEKVEPTLNPGQDPRKVVVVLNVTERNTGSVAAGAGISSATGLFGTISYQEQNLGGNNQKIGAQLQVGERALLFDVSFTDPWIAGDPFRTSYTVNGFRRRSLSLIYTGGDNEVRLPNDDRPRILRLGGGVTFTRPLGPAPLDADWKASLGFEYQRVTIRDASGDVSPKDELGNDLSLSGEGKDDLLSLQFGIARDKRDNPLKPTSGSVLRFSSEQFLPVGLGSVFGNRLRGSYSYYIPVKYVRFSKGPQTLAFNVQAGTFLGDLPPYEAFALGGSNSVRGWDEGDVGSGRSFIQATAEYRFPIFSVVGGALFVDVASDLGSGSDVPGDPAGARDKPGSGFGYGLGIRVDSPLGPIRIDYGFNNDGGSRFHFGIGERF